VEIDVVSEWSWFKGDNHTLQNHFLIEVGCAEGGFAEAVDESTQRLVLFLFDAKKGYGCGLMWAASSEVGGKHAGEGVKTFDGVWGKGSEPFKGGTFKGGRKSFTKDDIVGYIEGNVGYVYFKVLVRVGFSRIAVQCEGFPLDGERCVGDGVNERVATFGW